MRAIDTNVFIRLISRDNPLQTALAESFIENGAWVPILALAETTWVLRTVYKLSPANLALIIEMLLEHKNLTLQDSELISLALELFRSRPSLCFSDCLRLQLARGSRHLPLGTFDRAFAKVDGTQKL